MNNHKIVHASIQQRLCCLFYFHVKDMPLTVSQMSFGDVSRLYLIDNEIIRVLETGKYDPGIPVTFFGNHIHGCLVSFLLQGIQGTCRHNSILGILFIQLIQEQEIAQMEDTCRSICSKNMLQTQFSIGPPEVEECTCGPCRRLRHHIRIRRRFIL